MNSEINPTPGYWKPAGAAVLSAAAAAAADVVEVDKLIAQLQSQDENVRGEAWQGAATVGWSAVKPLALLMTHQDFEIARAAKRALWKIVRHAARPKAEKERQAVQAELVALLKAPPATVQCEAAWMLSEIGDASSVQELARQLKQIEVREAARCALERLPGPKAIRALEQALKSAPEDFRPALASSLRARGCKVADDASQKLLPSRKTTVEAKS
jgi:HEAT repeat protein